MEGFGAHINTSPFVFIHSSKESVIIKHKNAETMLYIAVETRLEQTNCLSMCTGRALNV